MSENFKREIRYDVVKLKTGKKVNCVVVEEDWPEYEIVWKMLQDRMEGRPNELSATKRKLEAAEARIRASQEQQYGFVPEFVKFRQEPCGCRYAEYELQLTDCGGEFEGDAPKLYAAPVIPPDVQEVMDELLETSDKLEESQRENAELTRKLAEQTTFADKYAREVLELTRLLSEAKSKAVPEGWQLVPIEPTEEMVIAGCGNAKDKSRWIADRIRIYKAMIAASPSPETDIDQEQRFK